MMTAVAEAIQRLVDIALGVDPVEMVIQIVATLILVVVVKVFFWDKVTGFLDQRRTFINKEIEDATSKNEEASALKTDAEEALAEAREEAKSIVDEAKNQAEEKKRSILDDAKRDAQQVKKNARRDIEQEVEVARNELREEIVEIASLLSEKAIKKQISKRVYDKLIDEAIEEVNNQ
ncbi:MAG: F0F1 ATP synthase subunit B [Bacillota bacterium]